VKRLFILAAALVCACTREAPPPAAPVPAPATAPSAPIAPSAPAATPRERDAPARPPPELTTAAFKRFADARRKEVRRCYDAALTKDPALRGKIMLRFAVMPSGAVDEVEVASTSFRNSPIPACVAAVFRGWRTPFRPEEPVGIEYPLSFAPQR